MNVHLPAPRRKWPSRLVNLAVVVVVLALAAATFVLSYSGVHAIALQDGVSARLARVYPGLFDAVLVIACVAAVMLRDARWWARTYAWLVIIVVMAVVGAADAVHAMDVVLPHRKTEGVVAAAPWVLVLLGFSLMLTMLRYSRAQHADGAPAPDRRAARRAKKGAVAQEEPTAPTAVLPPAVPALPPGARLILPLPDPEPTAPAHAAALAAEPVPAPEEEALAAQTAPTREEPVFPEPTPTLEEPVIGEPAPTRAEPVIPAAEAPEASADAGSEPGGFPGADEAPREVTADAEQEPTPAAPENAENAENAEDATVATEPAELSHDYWHANEQREAGEQDRPAEVPEIDQDAPPFATAPFATVPRLNRVRATPVPPEDDED